MRAAHHPVGVKTMTEHTMDQRRFPDRVTMIVARIPPGRVTTYGRIARALGSPRSARMVGWVMSSLPPDHELPAHRVVNRVGELSGAHAWGHPEIMRDLLEEEGVPFRSDWCVDLEACVWDPADEPDLDGLISAVPE
jgi:methylated-DNA-protein-cysteine methyltransferase related protein